MPSLRVVGRPVRAVLGPSVGMLLSMAPALAQGTSRVSVDSAGAEANLGAIWNALSADGRFVVFQSDSTNLVANDTNGVTDIFVRDRAAGTTERVSVDSTGAEANDLSLMPSISADGNVVVFFSIATNLVAGDTNAEADVFVHDRTTGITERVNVDSNGAEADFGSYGPASLSADGRFVAFPSNATNFDPIDTNQVGDIYLRDRFAGVTELISVTPKGRAADDSSGWPSISADGQVVAFSSYATNLVPGDSNGSVDIFVRDRSIGTTERISVTSNRIEADDHSFAPSISADGRFVAFESYASNLVVGDANGREDVFLRDRVNATTDLVSVDSSGAFGNDISCSAAISADGTHVAFTSQSSNLVPNDTNGTFDVFVHSIGSTELVSVDSSGGQGNDISGMPTLSADGQIIAFYSTATNLVANDGNASNDIFVREPCTTDATWSNYGSGFAGTNGEPTFTSRSDPVLGSRITLDLGNSYGKDTTGLLFLGFQQMQKRTSWGGDLLVVPFLTLPVQIPAGGLAFTGDLPADLSLCGFSIDLQSIEADPSARKGVSFTQGLELVLGH